MKTKTDPALVQQATEFLNDEYLDSAVYEALAQIENNGQRKKLLLKLAQTEGDHYRFWKGIAGQEAREVNRWYLRFLLFMRRILGLTFTMKFLELHEREVVEQYEKWWDHLDSAKRKRLKAIIKDEEEHESYFMSQVDEAIVRYIGFVALGLSDAIIEITGVHAGFLGVMGSTLVAGIAGLVVGFAACISMGVAAYLKAKSEVRKSPLTSAFITSGSYLLAVILLAAPYFLTESMVVAFSVSVILAVLMSMSFTFYVSVVNETNFKREVLENTLLLLGTAVATYFFGDLLGVIFGVETAWH
ncbi:MAG TPA: VIT1/CCC1 family protein [Bacteroidota bacterium]|nr:VIT1/CCC1 family protein [Bacteroidota bacterium]